MSELAWGSKLAELAPQRFSGELRVQADSQWYWISFADGSVVNAASPAPGDTAARIAVSMHVITASQAHEVALRASADRRRDELDLIANISQMSDLDRDTFEADVIVRRAARTFALTTGKLTVSTLATLKPTRYAIPIQAVIFVGARMHMAEDKLARELREMGTFFKLVPDTDTSAYSFTDAEHAVVNSLREGASIDELEAKHRDVESRTLQAIAYSLVCTSAAVATTPRATPRKTNSPFVYDARSRTGPVPVVKVPREPSPDEMRAARRLATAPIVAVPEPKDDD